MFVSGYDEIVDLRQISTGELIDLLFWARGQQRCAWLRTKLNQRLEQRTGRRGIGGSQDKVLSNGNVKAISLNV